MKKAIWIVSSVLICLLVGVLLFWSYESYQQKELNNQVAYTLRSSSTNQLRNISKNRDTENYLLNHKVKSVSLSYSDNEGYKQFGYYYGTINNRRAMFNVTLTHNGLLKKSYTLTKVNADSK